MVDNVNANWGFGMRYGSVCSGVEAASLAWESLGWQPAWFAEIEPFPAAVLNHHWPHIPNHGDMTQLEARILSGEIEAPDILVGGTPCQAFSVAGLRNSLADERGNLTLVLVRILNAIDFIRAKQRKQPCILVWENVPGVLSTKDNAFGSFLGGLAGEELPLEPAGKRWTNAGCVFGEQRSIAWRVLDAQFFGVPQRRKRVFLVAGAGDIDPAEILFERQGKSRGVTPSESEKQDAAGFVEAGFGDFKQRNQAGTLKRTGGAIGGGSETLVVHGRQDPCVSDKAFCLDNQGAGNTNVVVTVAATGEARDSREGTAEQERSGKGWVGETPFAVRRLTVEECEFLQGFPRGYTQIPWRGKPAEECPDAPRYKACGNSMAVPCMRFIGKRIQGFLNEQI